MPIEETRNVKAQFTVWANEQYYEKSVGFIEMPSLDEWLDAMTKIHQAMERIER